MTNIVTASCLNNEEVTKKVALSNPFMKVIGAKHTRKTADGLEFLRFPAHVLNMGDNAGFNTAKGKVTTCVELGFTTKSEYIKMKFKFNEEDRTRRGRFIVMQNSKRYKTFRFNGKDRQASLNIKSREPGKAVNYSIIMPLFANPILTEFVISKDSKIEKSALPKKKVYVALGDSITHGTGQQDSTQTFPYQLAAKLNMNLFNLAVAGSMISVPAAKSLIGWDKIDLITILVGYNDFHFEGKTDQQYREKYNEMIDAIRKNHPRTKLFCISPLYTKRPVSKTTGINISKFRDVVKQVSKTRQSKGDKNIFFIAGDKITSERNLRGQVAPTDSVHLGIEGASLFADQLYKKIKRQKCF